MLYELARILMLDLILQWENDFNITAVIYQIYFPTLFCPVGHLMKYFLPLWTVLKFF